MSFSTVTGFSKLFQTKIRPTNWLIIGVLVVLSGAVGLAGCGGDSTSPPPNYAKKLADSPAPLAALHAQGDELLDGGKEAFEDRMEKLKGFPAVVNVWASWCGPCRAEFPHFQQASANLGRKVAFLGVNSEDSEELASNFLNDNAVPYPSYSDSHREIADSLDVTAGYPATAFFDADGKQTYLRSGPYPDQETLEADVQAYAVEGGQD